MQKQKAVQETSGRLFLYAVMNALSMQGGTLAELRGLLRTADWRLCQPAVVCRTLGEA